MAVEKTILKIEPSNPRNPNPYNVTLLFDEPNEIDKGHYMMYVYSVKHEGEEKTMFAYSGLFGRIDALNCTKGDEISILKTGEGQDTRWDVQKIGGNHQRSQQSQQKAPAQSPVQQQHGNSTNSVAFFPTNSEKLSVLTAIMSDQMMLLDEAMKVAMSSEYGWVRSLSPDGKKALAVGLVINSDRTYRPNMTAQSQSVAPDGDFVTKVMTKKQRDNAALMETILAVIADDVPIFQGHGDVKGRNGVVRFFKAVGLSSGGLLETDQTTWLPFWNAAVEYQQLVDGGMDSAEAVGQVQIDSLFGSEDELPF